MSGKGRAMRRGLLVVITGGSPVGKGAMPLPPPKAPTSGQGMQPGVPAAVDADTNARFTNEVEWIVDCHSSLQVDPKRHIQTSRME